MCSITTERGRLTIFLLYLYSQRSHVLVPKNSIHTFVLMQNARNRLLITTEHPLKAGFPVTFNRKSNQNSRSVLAVSERSPLVYGHAKTPVGRRFISFLVTDETVSLAYIIP